MRLRRDIKRRGMSVVTVFSWFLLDRLDGAVLEIKFKQLKVLARWVFDGEELSALCLCMTC